MSLINTNYKVIHVYVFFSGFNIHHSYIVCT